MQVPLKLTRLERLTFRLFIAWLPAGWRLFAERGIGEARAALKRAMPFMLCGDCLAPWLRDGDALCVTTEIEPQPGDLVLDMGDRINDIDPQTDRRLLREVADVFRGLATDRVHLLGNHDMCFMDRTANEEMQKVQGGLGLPPGLNIPGFG